MFGYLDGSIGRIISPFKSYLIIGRFLTRPRTAQSKLGHATRTSRDTLIILHPHRQYPRICIYLLLLGRVGGLVGRIISSPLKASMANHHALFYSDGTTLTSCAQSSIDHPHIILYFANADLIRTRDFTDHSVIHCFDWVTPPLGSLHCHFGLTLARIILTERSEEHFLPSKQQCRTIMLCFILTIP